MTVLTVICLTITALVTIGFIILIINGG